MKVIDIFSILLFNFFFLKKDLNYLLDLNNKKKNPIYLVSRLKIYNLEKY